MRMGFFEKHFGGHWNLGRNVTIYGFNAMHVAVNVKTRRWGYVCFHPTIRCFGRWWPWDFYVSPNATPWASTFAAGPGLSRGEKRLARERRAKFGHNFDTTAHDAELGRINGYA